MDLSLRLKTAGDKVPPYRIAADVGTDHGMLAVYLAKEREAEKVFACDISELSLEKARRLIQKEKLDDLIIPVHCDGLELLPRDINSIIICGMGGYTIKRILENAPWVQKEDMQLVLCPHTDVPVIRKYLLTSGFEPRSETAVEEKGKLYCVMEYWYHSDKIPYFDDQSLLRGYYPLDDAGRSLLKAQIRFLNVRYSGQKLSGDPEAKKSQKMIGELTKLLNSTERNQHGT